MGNCTSKIPTDNSFTGLLSNAPSNTITLANTNNTMTDGTTIAVSNQILSGNTSYKNKKDIVVLLTKPERKILIDGYIGHEMNAILLFPNDVIELIVSVFMDESFYWSLKHEQLYKLRHETESVLSYTSSVFIYRNIHFQLQLTKIFKEHNDHGFQLSARLLSKNVVITTTIALQCIDTKCGYHNFVENFFESGWPSSTLKLSDIDDDVSELNFICSFDILGIEPMYDHNCAAIDAAPNDACVIHPFYKQVEMKQKVNLLWRLANDMKASYRTDNDDTSLILFYESPQFENGSYVVHFIQSNVIERDGFAVMLELFTYPQFVSKLTLKWTVMVIYDGKIIKKSSADSFALNESCHSKAFSKSDFHFIGETNVFSLSLLSIKVDIEILEIYDESNQIIPWEERRHWPQCGIYNELCSNLNANSKSRQNMDDKIKTIDEKLSKLLAQSSTLENNNEHVIKQRDDDDDDSDISEFKQWLSNIGLLSYFELLLQQGFDSLEMMQEINDVHELNYIGINLKAHQIKLMNHIKKLKVH